MPKYRFSRLAVIFEPFFSEAKSLCVLFRLEDVTLLVRSQFTACVFFIEINRGRNKEYVKCTERLSIWCVICCLSPED